MTDDHSNNTDTTNTENIKFEDDKTTRVMKTIDADAIDADGFTDEEDSGFHMPDMDEGMMAQVQEMMAKMQKSDELEKENADLKNKLGRLAADFESYRNRMQQELSAAESKGISKATETLMPVYDDLDRAVTMGSADPVKLIPGMQTVQNKLINLFSSLGLEPTGKVGEAFDPQWHEALQVVEGDTDDQIAQVFQVGFRMGDQLVRPARVVVSRKS